MRHARRHHSDSNLATDPVPVSDVVRCDEITRITDAEQLSALAQLAGRLVECDNWTDAARWADATVEHLVPGARVTLMKWDPNSVAVAIPQRLLQAGVAPIVVEGDIVGVIQCSARTFGPRAFTLMRAVARLMARYARAQALRDTLRERSSRDSLTNLFNRGYFDRQLEVELSRAVRHGRPLGLVMFDVDAFKRFNTEIGYAAGDAVLKRIAGLLAAGVRNSDVVCRLGGDEIAVILWDASIDAALRRACSLVDRVSASSYVDHPALGPAITVTAGVAVFPTHADAGAKLLACADQALRAAKQHGGETVCVFGRDEPTMCRRENIGDTMMLDSTWPSLDVAG